MARPLDLVGDKYGRLEVLKFVYSKNYRNYWLCKCDCGNEKIVSGHNLRCGVTKSCGCLQQEQRKINGKKVANYTREIKHTTTHGQSKTRLYNIWAGMKARCYNPNDINYKDYGARGIKICEEWFNSFSVFRDWAIANGYADNLTIDRIDVNGNYCPENCRWATLKEQAKNKRTTRLITYDNKTMCVNEWEKFLNFPIHLIAKRLKRGWSIEEALTIPVLNKGKKNLSRKKNNGSNKGYISEL